MAVGIEVQVLRQGVGDHRLGVVVEAQGEVARVFLVGPTMESVRGLPSLYHTVIHFA